MNTEELIKAYTVKRPAYPMLLKLLYTVVGAGLLGLGIVAFETFNQAHGPVVAGLFATVIEVGAITDAVGLSQGINRDNWWVIPAILLTLAVSGWYNLATVTQSGATWGVKDPLSLEVIRHAIAWGPLGALGFMAFGLGKRISMHEENVKAWEEKRQAWVDGQMAKTDAVQVEARRLQLEAQQRKEEAERKERERLAEIEANSRKQVELAKIAQADREAQRQARLEARKIKLEAVTKQVETSTPLPGSGGDLPGSAIEPSRGTYQDFQELLRNNGHHEWKNEELSRKFNVSTRTITAWRAKFLEEHPTFFTPEMN